jgi:hypothetical protein
MIKIIFLIILLTSAKSLGKILTTAWLGYEVVSGTEADRSSQQPKVYYIGSVCGVG